MGNVEKKGEVKKNGKQFLFSTVFVLAGLVAISSIYIFSTGKYRLFLKPHPSMLPMSGKGQAITPAHKESKAIRDDDLEYILQKYTVDFYMGRTRFNGNPSLLESIKVTAVEIPPSIKLIAGLEKEKGYYERITSVNSLGNNLSEKEVSALLSFLHKKLSDDNLALLEFDAVKNDAVMALMRQTVPPEELAPHLIAMYHDRTLDNTWRNYCIQFMGQWYDSVHVPGQQDLFRKSLDEALSDDDAIPAAALIAMSNLVGRPGFSKERISAAAYRLSTDPKTGGAVKTASIQICAKFRNREAIPVAREIVKSSSDVPLKLSAVAALGTFGDPADRELINSLASSGDIRMRTAAKAALKKIKM